MEKKKMWGVFNETGVFASACPHSFILWLADMVQSGEQFVLPLLAQYMQADPLNPGGNILLQWFPRQWTPSAQVF